jgi:ribulose-phosphate 3-epimerase
VRVEPGELRVRLGSALFNADHTRLGDELSRVEAAGLDFVHLDVFDGSLVPDLAFAPRTVAALRPLTRLPFEVHLVTRAPERYLAALADAGVERIYFHVESGAMVYETAFAIRELGLSPGVAVGLGGPLDMLVDAIPFVDAALLLARVTGEGTRGAAFQQDVVDRIGRVREANAAVERRIEIQCAGGVNRSNAAAAVRAGADALVLGAGLHGFDDPTAEVAAIREASSGARG